MPIPTALGRGSEYLKAKEEAEKAEWPWPLNAVQDYLEGLFNWVRDIGQSIVDSLGDAIGSLGKVVGDIAGAIYEQLEGVAKTITGTLGAAIEGLGSWIVDAFASVVDALKEALAALWDGFVAVVSAVWDWIKDHILGPLWDALKDFFEKLVDMIVSAAQTIFNAVINIATPGSPLEPEQALAAFGAVSATVLGASMIVTTINAAHPFKEVVGEQVVAFIYKFLGFNELVTAFWGSIGNEVLDYPMRLWARMTFRSRVPGHAEADEMLWHGQISRDEWHKIHTYEGWKDEYIQAHYASQWKNPSVREIGMIMDAVGLPADKIQEMLRELGYNPEDLPLLTQVLARRPTINELRELRSELLKETVEGAMSVPELEVALRALGHTEAELALLRQIVGIRILRRSRAEAAKELEDFKNERVKALTEAYRRDLLTEGEYLEELLDVGVEQNKASQMVYLEEVRKLPKPRRTISPEVVVV